MPTPEERLANSAGGLSLVLGAVTLVGIAVGFAFTGQVAPVIKFANLGVALLEVPLGLGVMRLRRGAWAFLITAAGTLTLIHAFAIPGLLRSGGPGKVGAVLAAGQAVLLALLAVSSKAFRRVGEPSRG